MASAKESGGPGNGGAPKPLQPGNKGSQTTAHALGMTHVWPVGLTDPV